MTDISRWIARCVGLVPAGAAVLDVAAGGGRHTRFFRGRGHPVTAIDRDVSELADLVADPGTDLLSADLEGGAPWPLPGRTFGAVIVANYLHRPLWPRLVEALAPSGGVLLYETFMVGNERFGRPSNPDFLLRRDELRDLALAAGLDVMAFEQGDVAEPRPATTQRIAARRR